MSKQSNQNLNLGCTFSATMLGTAFVVLKLCKVIDWSWWLVTLPFWIGLGVGLVILGLFVFGFLAYLGVAYGRKRNH